MVNLLLLSHSKKLVEGLKEVASQMASNVKIEISGGTDSGDIGSNFDEVKSKIDELSKSEEGLVILFDAGSSMLNAQMAIEMLGDDDRQKVVLADTAMVEGAIQISIMADSGQSLEDIKNYINENKLNKLN